MGQKHFIDWIEWRAIQLRRKCGLFACEPLDPYSLAEAMNVTVINAYQIRGLAKRDRRVLDKDADSWDGGAMLMPDGNYTVVLNPTRTDNRQRATLMEELAHIHLEHRATQLRSENGIVLREFRKAQETQAYWVGAAALVPRPVLERALEKNTSMAVVAYKYSVSIQLVAFRARIMGLNFRRAI